MVKRAYGKNDKESLRKRAVIIASYNHESYQEVLKISKIDKILRKIDII